MDNLEPGIRNAVRAVIVRDDQLLLLHKRGGPRGERYALPGGAQDAGETLLDALQRECVEEIASEVMVRQLLHVADYFKPRETVPPTVRHLVEFLFLCDLPVEYQPRMGHHPDKHQIGVVWRPLGAISALPLLPSSLSTHLADADPVGAPVYLGTID